MGIGDWGLGIGDWGPNPQSPIPNPQSPIPIYKYISKKIYFKIYLKSNFIFIKLIKINFDLFFFSFYIYLK